MRFRWDRVRTVGLAWALATAGLLAAFGYSVVFVMFFTLAGLYLVAGVAGYGLGRRFRWIWWALGLAGLAAYFTSNGHPASVVAASAGAGFLFLFPRGPS